MPTVATPSTSSDAVGIDRGVSADADRIACAGGGTPTIGSAPVTDHPVDTARPPAEHRDAELGRGRSGVVYRGRDEGGNAVARKVFGSSGLSKLVQYVLLGTPNPYAWNEAAIRTAVLRRRVVATLVEFWFGRKLRVAHAYGYCWNTTHRSYEMRCALVRGRHVALQHTYPRAGLSELRDAVRGVMRPLQARLTEAGLDGLVWQAGRGNPVALNNFMCEGPDGEGGNRWAWIDLESGIPALFPINPLDLLLFYLPKSVRHRRPLFDDVDVAALRGYVERQEAQLLAVLGDDRVAQLVTDIDALGRNQRDWKSVARYRRCIAYRRTTGAIGQDQADWYDEHPVRWYCSEARRAARSAVSGVARGLSRGIAAIRRLPVARFARGLWSAIRCQRYREHLARDYVGTRIARWDERGQLDSRHVAELSEHLQREEGCSYLTDFGAHLAIKPFVKIIEFWIVPALWMMGAVGDQFLGIALVATGPAARTLYTLCRLIQNAATGRERPWIALWVGAFPVLGNVAYPLQIICSGTHRDGSVARFILYDTFSRIGRCVPIWGGPDTLTEHLLNRCPDLVIRPPRSEALGCSDEHDTAHHAETPNVWRGGAIALPASREGGGRVT